MGSTIRQKVFVLIVFDSVKMLGSLAIEVKSNERQINYLTRPNWTAEINPNGNIKPLKISKSVL